MKEEEIRPAKIFDEYLSLAQKDTDTYFSSAERIKENCPACGSNGHLAFVKYNFTYESCPNCNTLFVNPRPVAEAFFKYYKESLSSKYWATTFYKETAQARREKIWKPKAKLIFDKLASYNALDFTIVDIGGGYGLFAEEMREITKQPLIVIEPSPYLAEVCRKKSLFVIEKFLEEIQLNDLPIKPKVFLSFELFEHLHNPSKFLTQLNLLMLPGDLFIFTTLSSAGLDIQILWENSKSVMPPHHLNFFNPKSVEILLSQKGFESIEITTPGKLDIDILCNNQSDIKDRFWSNLISSADDKEKALWQETLSESGRSSHMMIICRKK